MKFKTAQVAIFKVAACVILPIQQTRQSTYLLVSRSFFITLKIYTIPRSINLFCTNYIATQNSAAHHNLMADKLITDIAQGIRGYVEANTPEIKNHSEITMEQYKAVAWNGLRDTDAFTKLSAQAQKTITDNTSMLQSFTVHACK